MSINECDLIRGFTYKRYHIDPSSFKYTVPNIVLIHRTSTRNIKNEQEIINMLSFARTKLNVYLFFLIYYCSLPISFLG